MMARRRNEAQIRGSDSNTTATVIHSFRLTVVIRLSLRKVFPLKVQCLLCFSSAISGSGEVGEVKREKG